MDRDPTPGDPSRVKALSIQLHDFADDVESALRLVKGMQSEEAILSWAGRSADAFREEFGSTPGNLDKLHTSYRLAADALESYWPELEHAQYQADRALADGRTAHAQLVSAQGGLSGATDWVSTASATADSYDPAKNPGKAVPPPGSDQVRQAVRDAAAARAQQAQAQQAVTSAQSALDAAKRLAEQARGMREDAARRTVTKLHEASDAGIRNRHWWEKAVHWVADHWDEIVTVCKWIVAILGIVVMIIGGPLAWLVVAAALIVLADTVRKYIQGKATLWDVLFAAPTVPRTVLLMRDSKSDKQATARVDDAAIYCRISQAGDEDQTGVDRQERICRDIADRLGVRVSAVYVDNNRSAWQRNRRRPGWDQLLEEMAEGGFGHVIVYHPDRLMRQPRDLEELLTIADDRHIVLHGQANRKDLSDPDDRFILRIEVAHACRSSDDTSRRVKDALDDRARAGDPHTGRRQYGYAKDGRTIVEEEAEVIREIFRRFLDGESPTAIARDLHARRIRTAEGAQWQGNTVRNMLDSPRVAAVRVHRGKRVGMGNWPPIIDLGVWEEVRQLRAFRTAQEKVRVRQRKFYLLRGVVVCTCGTRMGGSSGSNGQYIYRCGRSSRNGEARCKRTVSAEPLEDLIKDLALKVLEELDITGRPTAAASRPNADAEADAADERQLRELNEMWLAKEIPTPEYRAMRRQIEDRVKERQRVSVQRPFAVLEGIAGPGARKAWRKLEEAKDYQRMNAVFRFLYAAVIIHPTDRRGPGLDYDRIEVEPNPLD